MKYGLSGLDKNSCFALHSLLSMFFLVEYLSVVIYILDPFLQIDEELTEVVNSADQEPNG